MPVIVSVVDEPGATSKLVDFEVAPVAVTRMHCTSEGACVTAICAVPTLSDGAGALPSGALLHPVIAPIDTAPATVKYRKFMDILLGNQPAASYRDPHVVKRRFMCD
jgi:putative intracellular protease/amidase